MIVLERLVGEGQKMSIGTADGLARVPRQAICYANADLVSDAFRAVNGLRHS